MDSRRYNNEDFFYGLSEPRKVKQNLLT